MLYKSANNTSTSHRGQVTLGGRRESDKSSNFPVHVFTETGNQVISTDLPLHLATYHHNQQFTNKFYLDFPYVSVTLLNYTYQNSFFVKILVSVIVILLDIWPLCGFALDPHQPLPDNNV